MSQKNLFYLAYHDPLTKLGNRISFQEKLQAILDKTNIQKSKVAILFIDMDHFKHFNDLLGYIAGDKLLKLVAAHLKKTIPKKYALFRIGGDEFVLIMHHVSDLKIVGQLSKKIIASFKKSFLVEEQKIYMETSIGISIYPNDGKHIQQLLKHADSALKLAKEIGGNNYQFCTPKILQEEKQLVEIEGRLRRAVLYHDLFVYYQPLFSIKNKTFLGFEALLRWRHQDTILKPEQFIQIVEKKGLVVPIGKWTLNTVCKTLHHWKKQFPKLKFQVAVNISPKQLRPEAHLLSTVKKILAKTQVHPTRLSFEITENSLMHDIKGRVALIHELKKLGISIAIDDFGIGYSSLNYIKYFPVDILKIDKSFIEQIDHPRTCSIIQHMIAMAKNLGMQTIAEGIETKEQYLSLKREKADIGQGYFFGKPMSEEQATQFLERL